MSNSLTRAFGDSQRSYLSAKASVSQISSELLAHGPSGILGHRPDLARSSELCKHFRGWCFSAIRAIANAVAAQPIHVGRKTSAKPTNRKGQFQPHNVEPLESHELLTLFGDPNPLQTSWSLSYTTTTSLELTGRSLWWLPDKKAIWPIPTSWIRRFEGTTRFTSFVISPPHSAEEFSLDADECCYFAYPHPNDPHGAYSPTQAALTSILADEAIQTSQLSSFKQGIHPSIVLTVGAAASNIPGTRPTRPRLSGSQQRQIISAIQKRWAGTLNDGHALILDGLIESAEKLSMTPEEMNWLESSQLTKSRILESYGVNEFVLGSNANANRASALESERAFLTYCIGPKIRLMSEVLTEFLSPMFGGGIEIWLEPPRPRDDIRQAQWAALLSRYGSITGDELRELSPFDLELGGFPDPVTPATARQDPKEAALLDKLDGQVDATTDELKRFLSGSLPERIDRMSDDIVRKSSMNGRHK